MTLAEVDPSQPEVDSQRARQLRAANRALAVLLVLGLYLVLRPLADALVTYSLGPSATVPLLALLIGGCAAWWFVERGAAAYVSYAGWAVLLFGCVSVASAATAADPTLSLQTAAKMLAPVVAFLIAEQLGQVDDRVPSVLAGAAVAGLGTAAAVAAAQVLGLVASYPNEEVAAERLGWVGRVPGSFASPGLLGVGLVIMILLLVGLARPKTTELRIALAASLVLLAGLLVINETRGAAIGLGVGGLVLTALHRRWSWIAAGAVSGLALVPLLPSGFLRSDEIAGDASGSTLGYRIELWQTILPRFWQHPVLGSGPGQATQWNPDRLPPHNAVVQAVVEMGALGLLALLLVIVTVAVSLGHRLRLTESPLAKAQLATCLSLGAAYVVIGLSENTLTTVVWSVPVACVTGAVIGATALHPAVGQSDVP